MFLQELLLIDLDKKDEAIKILADVLEKKPDYTDATVALGDLLIEKEDYKEAVNIYTEALKYSPTSYDLNYNLGINLPPLRQERRSNL